LKGLWLIFEGWEGKAQRDAGDYFLGKKPWHAQLT
jgi:hypothetical protein